MNGFWDKDQNSYFWPKFAPFTPFLGKWEFSVKIQISQFLEFMNL